MKERRLDEARSLFEESLRCSETVLRGNLLHDVATEDLMRTLLNFSQLDAAQGRAEECLARLQRAVDIGETLVRTRPDTSSIWLLAEARKDLAAFLALQGDHERAKSLTAANRRMFEPGGPGAENARFSAWRIYIQLKLNRPSRPMHRP